MNPLPLTERLGDGSTPESQDLSVGVSSESRAVCCMWLAGKCWHKGDHFLGKRLFLHEDVPGLQCGFGSSCKHKHYAQLKEGMVICVKVEGSRLMPGKILQLSRLEGVRVKVSNLGKRDEVDWLPLHRLLIPDFSQIEKGMRVTVVEEADSSKQFLCTVLEVSCDKDRALAPVCVRYNGHGPESDEWVGVDRLRSKSLILHEPVPPTNEMQGHCSDSLEQPNASAVTSRWRAVERDPPAIANISQSSNHDLQRPSVAQDVASADLLDASAANALPWHEPDSEADAFDRALQATEEALTQQAQAEEWRPKLEQTLAEVKTEALQDLLERHNWSGRGFDKLLFFSHPDPTGTD